MKKTVALCALALVVGVAASIILGCTEKKALYVYTWADYIDPDLIAKFESENNCEVVIDKISHQDHLPSGSDSSVRRVNKM